jgi:methyltransferase FkbM-like protein
VARVSPAPAETVAVAGVTLDGLAARGVYDSGSVGLLWVDTQGGEGRVLAGASTLLQSGVPVVVAVRRRRENYAPLRQALAEYAEFVDLRTGRRDTDLGSLLDSVARSTDILALPR